MRKTAEYGTRREHDTGAIRYVYSNPFAQGESDFNPHLHQEWLVKNGLNGYASGTVLGPITRRSETLIELWDELIMLLLSY